MVYVCGMPVDWIVGPYLRLIRCVGNHEMFNINNWIVRPLGSNDIEGFLIFIVMLILIAFSNGLFV